ncbi:hypothetical protein PZ895_08075 [Mesorhizobium sp. YIM 152430]|uniref:hypothetical protein n=1 Tax=Mesorhizobium sp. YIM 152430 TaxID=3031761 RepID=UPI0023DBC536|nr:hypothetical protein [Mesorhizobium sp. YIM 152430]MDF1599733.1 hypothetical protein [Mesorhizobium sp. YIM 152430]
MTKTTPAADEVSAGAPAMRSVQIDPLVALAEAQALCEFYRNRCLILANENHVLRTAAKEYG